MVFKTTFTKTPCAAFTLVEVLVALGLGSVVLAAVLSFLFFSTRSLAAMTNYLDLQQKTQMALDQMSREIRQVNRLTVFSSNSMTFQDYDGGTLQYTWNPTAKTVTRVKGSVTKTFLTGCDSLQFYTFQRTPSNATFLPFSTSSVTDTKLIELKWNCSRTILGTKADTETMQSAKVVIRRK
jgi:prepilin-type N-terminal cleavage/methylation domain-containing protein